MNDISGPAFPQDDASGSHDERKRGMSLRDYFAAAALQGIITRATSQDALYAAGDKPTVFSDAAYIYADAMLAARQKGET
jgi:hypothetical protein